MQFHLDQMRSFADTAHKNLNVFHCGELTRKT